MSFVSVTQSFNTTASMGGLTLDVLLSFAEFEREVTGERIRDKIAAPKKRGLWMGGVVPLGYRVQDRALHIIEEHAAIVRDLFQRYIDVGTVVRLQVGLTPTAAVQERIRRAHHVVRGSAELKLASSTLLRRRWFDSVDPGEPTMRPASPLGCVV